MTRPGQPMDRDQAYRLALVLQARARLDAAEWVARLPRQLSLLARGRADQIIENDRSDDPLRAALAREWYVRVFTDHARNQLGLGRPEVEVTPTEAEHLAECLRTGVAYRIHGPGGSIVANPDGPATVPGQNDYAERQHDTGPASDVGPAPDVAAGPQLTDRQTQRVLHALADAQDRRRAEDLQLVGAAWDDLTSEQRTAFAQYWHQHAGTHGHGAFPAAAPATSSSNAEIATPVEPAARSVVADSGRRTPVPGEPAVAAAGVFGTEAADLAAARAAYTLAAQAFPRGQEKPSTITSTGQVRRPASAGLESDPDRSR